MSEHEETAKRIMQAWGPQTTLGDSRRAIAAELAAAEQRGRRRGLEEGSEIRTLLVETIYWLKARTLPSRALNADLIARVDAAVDRFMDLAPRDSAPRKHKCMRCGGEFECRTEGCAAGYDVLPNRVERGADGEPRVVEHDCTPRDSGITSEWLTEIAKDADDTGFVPAMNPARICRCGVVTGGHVVHAPTCFMAPRDSGKEG